MSVQVIEKRRGSYRVIQTVGSSKDPFVIERLWKQAVTIVHGALPNQQQLLDVKTGSEMVIENFVEGLSNAQIHLIGPELIFGTLFDRIGFNEIKERLFRHLVVARLSFPGSKLKTVGYLHDTQGIDIGVSTIYRFLDAFRVTSKDLAESIAYRYSKQILGTISVVFYDMTTLYFETEDEDDLRKIGFSKDGKFQQPQIMIGLLVGSRGYPIGYDVFEGNTFEGHTLIPTLKKIQQKYGFDKPVVIADAGLLSKQNIKDLRAEGYEFILGARIKNESEEIKATILERAMGLTDGASFSLELESGAKLHVTYSDTRARKDAWNRERGLKKLRSRIGKGRLTKASVTNRGYNKFLQLEGTMTCVIDEEKVRADKRWDGLKGYVTNTKWHSSAVVENYGHLWQIEKAFRISKTDLQIRPIFHYRKRRIEAHLCIAFVAYTIYKELERLLQEHKTGLSVERAARLTHVMYALSYTMPDSHRQKQQILRMSDEQKLLYNTVCSKK